MLGQTLAFAPNYNAAKMAAGRLFYLIDRKPRIPSPDENANELVCIYGLKLHTINCINTDVLHALLLFKIF
jgi:hypothetical protein